MRKTAKNSTIEEWATACQYFRTGGICMKRRGLRWGDYACRPYGHMCPRMNHYYRVNEDKNPIRYEKDC